MALRELVSEGVAWTVWDVHPLARTRLKLTSVDMQQGWLCFECEAEKRRLAPIPAGWEEWSESELEACLRAAPRVERKRGAPPASSATDTEPDREPATEPESADGDEPPHAEPRRTA